MELGLVDILKTKTLPVGLTSYDLLKTLAIIFMVVDHIGYFFYPEEMWWRIVGRFSVPIWFFLIGYAETRDIPKLFWWCAGIVVVSAVVAGEHLFPVNIIFTLILARRGVDWMFRGAMRNKEAFAGMFFFLFLMSGPSMIFIEYGTLGMLFTLFGTIVKRRGHVTAPRWMIASYVAAVLMAYVLMQSILLPSLTGAHFVAFAVGMVFLCAGLYAYKPFVFEKVNAKSFAPVALLQLCGRRTLEIYVLHLMVFRGVAMAVDPERFGFLEFDVFAFKQLQELFLGAF